MECLSTHTVFIQPMFRQQHLPETRPDLVSGLHAHDEPLRPEAFESPYLANLHTIVRAISTSPVRP